jgi:hypothetical protein
MGLGECIGLSALDRMKLRDTYIPENYGKGYLHAELLGDPTLKMYLYEPPKDLAVSTTDNKVVNVSWAASDEPNVTGYYIYRSTALGTPFTLLNTSAVSGLSFADSTAPTGKNYYMVRAVKLQKTVSSGTFYNLSNGIIDSIVISRVLPVQLVAFTLRAAQCNVDLHWMIKGEENVKNYEVLYSTDGTHYSTLTRVDATNAGKYKVTHQTACIHCKGEVIYYKLKIAKAGGGFVFSNVINAKLNQTPILSILENPVANILTVKGLEETGSLRIIDESGKVLYTQKVQMRSVSIKADFLKSGTYFLQYLNKDNAYTMQFLKQ